MPLIHHVHIMFLDSQYNTPWCVIKATVTPKLRPGYDRFFLESLSNRRENVPLVVVVVGDRNQSQNQSQQGRQSCSKLQSCDYKSQTGLTWSYHQSEVLNSFLRLILLARPSATSRAISLRSSQNSNIFRSQLGRNMVVSPVWLRL